MRSRSHEEHDWAKKLKANNPRKYRGKNQARSLKKPDPEPQPKTPNTPRLRKLRRHEFGDKTAYMHYTCEASHEFDFFTWLDIFFPPHRKYQGEKAREELRKCLQLKKTDSLCEGLERWRSKNPGNTALAELWGQMVDRIEARRKAHTERETARAAKEQRRRDHEAKRGTGKHRHGDNQGSDTNFNPARDADSCAGKPGSLNPTKDSASRATERPSRGHSMNHRDCEEGRP